MEEVIAKWYAVAKSKETSRTPKLKGARIDGFYYESPTGIDEESGSPGYKGRPSGIGVRQYLPRAAKRRIARDLFTSAGKQGDNGEVDIGGLQEEFWDEDVTESGDEGWRRKGKRKIADI